MEYLDVLIIGAGPIGLACAIECHQRGWKYAVVDKGCLVNSLYHYPVNMTFFSTAERLEIGGLPFVCLQPKPGRAEALEYYRRVVVHFGLRLHLFEEITAINTCNSIDNKHDTLFSIATTKRNLQARKVIVATGFYDKPVLLNVPGEHLPKVTHFYKDPHFYAFRKILVVGANNSAVDAALECWRKGAEVTMVLSGADIGERVKYWVRPDIVNRIAEGSIKAFSYARVHAIRENTVDISTADGMITVENDVVLAMTGYQPDFSFLKQIGITLSDDEKLQPTYNPITMESNEKGIYLAGVVVGGMDTRLWFIENSRVHAVQIAAHLATML